MNRAVVLITAFLIGGSLQGRELEPVDLQFFGDLYLPYHILKKTKTSIDQPRAFEHVEVLLQSSARNIVNFEGTSTGTRVPYTEKSYHFKMPLWIGRVMKNVAIDAATLANNHTMDYGYPGLFDTLATLEQVGIRTTGAGDTIAEATRPISFVTAKGKVCLLAFSRTLPTSFWADDTTPGTAHLNFTKTAQEVEQCAERHTFTFVTFHWGAEGSGTPKPYQRKLARLVIKAGATAVIGHHPHVLQPIEFYRGRPIIYSLGNFVFGTRPFVGVQQGAAARFVLGDDGRIDKLMIVPINVSNRDVNFRPRLFAEEEKSALAAFVPSLAGCRFRQNPEAWTCTFDR